MPRPLVGTALTSKKSVHDLILWEIEKRYTRHAISLAAGTYEIGEVITNATLAPEAGLAGQSPGISDVLCLENITVATGDTVSVKALVRGPALVNFDEVVRTPGESDADLATRLGDLTTRGVRFVRETAIQTETDTFA